MTATVTRYVITHRGTHGLLPGRSRTLVGPAQGRNTYATREEAEKYLQAMVENNSRETLEEHYGLPLEVRPCECYPIHFDPKGIYFDD